VPPRPPPRAILLQLRRRQSDRPVGALQVSPARWCRHLGEQALGRGRLLQRAFAVPGQPTGERQLAGRPDHLDAATGLLRRLEGAFELLHRLGEGEDLEQCPAELLRRPRQELRVTDFRGELDRSSSELDGPAVLAANSGDPGEGCREDRLVAPVTDLMVHGQAF